MKPKNIFLIMIGATLTFLFCAQPGGLLRALAAASNPDHPLKVKHTHDDEDTVTWSLKKNGKGAFHLPVNKNQIIEWKNLDSKELVMAIVVDNTNDWDKVAGFKLPTYGPGCATCGQIDTMTGDPIQLTFTAGTQTKINYYWIAVANLAKTRDTTTNDYDMVEATVVWSDTFDGKDRKVGESKSP